MAGRKVFTSGEILTAADVNSFLMDQSVMVFADSTARSSAIPSPSEGMVTFREDQDVVEVFDGSTFKAVGSGFTDSETITATNASFSVPTLASPIVRVTVIGGGGGGAGGSDGYGGNGGTTIFNAGSAGAVGASGGFGGTGVATNDTENSGKASRLGFVAGNGGLAGMRITPAGSVRPGSGGGGGEVKVAYLNLGAVSSVNVTIGAGGAGLFLGSDGGRGEVILEYVAG